MTTRTQDYAGATGLAGIGLAALVLAGCGSPLTSTPAAPPALSSGSSRALSTSPEPSSTASAMSAAATPPPVAVKAADIDAAALAGVRAIEACDTRLDADPNDTVRRAVAWLTPGFARQVRAYPPVAAPGATWNQWAAHHAYLTVTTSLAGDDHPADSASAAYRQVIAVLHPLGRDGWTGPVQTRVVFVMLAPVHTAWRLASAQSSS